MRPEMISGSFCVSMTAAMGMPKFEAGPQKSKSTISMGRVFLWINAAMANVEPSSDGTVTLRGTVRHGNSAGYRELTRGTEVVQHRVGAYPRIDGFHCGSHCGCVGAAAKVGC